MVNMYIANYASKFSYTVQLTNAVDIISCYHVMVSKYFASHASMFGYKQLINAIDKN